MAKGTKFEGSLTYAVKRTVAGLSPYGESARKPEKTVDELLEELEKSDVKDVRKELVLTKVRERIEKLTKPPEQLSQPKPKRYLVDPETGRVSVDDEEGELTYKDALLVSASIKGKSGQYDDAIKLINLVKGLGKDSEGRAIEKPKEFYVDPETAIIVHDPDNGEYTLSEARAVSQSMQKGKAPDEGERAPGFLIDNDGNVQELKPGQPIVVKKVSREAGRTFFLNEKGDLTEQEAGKPLVIKVQAQGEKSPSTLPFPAIGRNGEPVYDGDGKPVYVDFEPQLRWLEFQGKERREDERHGALMSLATTVKENLGDGIAALKSAAEGAKGTGSTKEKVPEEGQIYECGDCHAQFRVPATDFTEATCPGCKRTYTREQVMGT